VDAGVRPILLDQIFQELNCRAHAAGVHVEEGQIDAGFHVVFGRAGHDRFLVFQGRFVLPPVHVQLRLGGLPVGRPFAESREFVDAPFGLVQFPDPKVVVGQVLPDEEGGGSLVEDVLIEGEIVIPHAVLARRRTDHPREQDADSSAQEPGAGTLRAQEATRQHSESCRHQQQEQRRGIVGEALRHDRLHVEGPGDPHDVHDRQERAEQG